MCGGYTGEYEDSINPATVGDNLNQKVLDDPVTRPAHYTSGEIECIDAMREAFGDEALKAFCKLNAFKYLWRSGKKGSEKEDTEKAIWYLRKSIGDDPRD